MSLQSPFQGHIPPTAQGDRLAREQLGLSEVASLSPHSVGTKALVLSRALKVIETTAVCRWGLQMLR